MCCPRLTPPPPPLPTRSVDYLHRECAGKRVFVLPAFETPRSPDQAAAHKVAGDAVAASKAGLEAMVGKRLVHQVGAAGAAAARAARACVCTRAALPLQPTLHDSRACQLTTNHNPHTPPVCAVPFQGGPQHDRI